MRGKSSSLHRAHAVARARSCPHLVGFVFQGDSNQYAAAAGVDNSSSISTTDQNPKSTAVMRKTFSEIDASPLTMRGRRLFCGQRKKDRGPKLWQVGLGTAKSGAAC